MKTILVVDDEDKIREVVVSYLERSGYKTLEAETGTEALETVRSTALDLVILDLMLGAIPVSRQGVYSPICGAGSLGNHLY